MHARQELSFPVASGKDGNDFIARAVAGVDAVDLGTAGAYCRGIVAHADVADVGVVREGVVEAEFGAAYDPASDSALLASNGTGQLIEAAAGDWIVAEYYDGGEVTADEIAAGPTLRRVIVRSPAIVPAP